MKISKTLLQAIMVGATMGAVSSCSLDNTNELKPGEHLEACDDRCDIDHTKQQGQTHHYDCPACGMG
jgi:hypothetical protein